MKRGGKEKDRLVVGCPSMSGLNISMVGVAFMKGGKKGKKEIETRTARCRRPIVPMLDVQLRQIENGAGKKGKERGESEGKAGANGGTPARRIHNLAWILAG